MNNFFIKCYKIDPYVPSPFKYDEEYSLFINISNITKIKRHFDSDDGAYYVAAYLAGEEHDSYRYIIKTDYDNFEKRSKFGFDEMSEILYSKKEK